MADKNILQMKVSAISDVIRKLPQKRKKLLNNKQINFLKKIGVLLLFVAIILITFNSDRKNKWLSYLSHKATNEQLPAVENTEVYFNEELPSIPTTTPQVSGNVLNKTPVPTPTKRSVLIAGKVVNIKMDSITIRNSQGKDSTYSISAKTVMLSMERKRVEYKEIPMGCKIEATGLRDSKGNILLRRVEVLSL